MILLDTNVLIYAADARSSHWTWAQDIIAESVASDGAAINAVSLAEICVGDAEPETVADRIRAWGVSILDVPAAAAQACAAAYLAYTSTRKAQSGKDSPTLPLPDFFIGAHAQVMGCPLATADEARFRTYFPSVELRTPPPRQGREKADLMMESADEWLAAPRGPVQVPKKPKTKKTKRAE